MNVPSKTFKWLKYFHLVLRNSTQCFYHIPTFIPVSLFSPVARSFLSFFPGWDIISWREDTGCSRRRCKVLSCREASQNFGNNQAISFRKSLKLTGFIRPFFPRTISCNGKGWWERETLKQIELPMRGSNQVLWRSSRYLLNYLEESPSKLLSCLQVMQVQVSSFH